MHSLRRTVPALKPGRRRGACGAQLALFTPDGLTYKQPNRPRPACGQRDGQKKTPKEDGMSTHSTEADVAFIQALAELLNRNDLTEVSVKREYAESDSLEVRVVKQANIVTTSAAAPAPVAVAVQTVPVAPIAGPGEDPAQHPGAVTSPMVGTVYLSAEPGTTPFVAIGATVAEGQTLLIIEAMKTMNQIPAPRAGVVRRIVVEDGSPVEYGAPLMIIE